MRIKLLSDTTINKIAAGEVIERPAAVIKELIENSIDAASTKIEVILEKSGKNLIIVSDNGHGMSPEDLELAVLRYTTSKLDEDDLLNINSFGFRGEALPSIGAISKMTITSRQKNSDQAFQIKVVGGERRSITPAVHNEGTRIEIRDLFFATPARLNFLRTDKTEFNACVEVAKTIAIAHPHISMSLMHDNKMIFKVRAGSEDPKTNLKKRIAEIISQEFIENAAYLESKQAELSVIGFTSIPTMNKTSADAQFLFVNNRPVRDKLLSVALRVAYQDYLARDRHPYIVIFLDIKPDFIDVNVHPAKHEVRFRDPNIIRNAVINVIRDALQNEGQKVSTTVAATALGYFNTQYRPQHNFNPLQSNTNYNLRNSFHDNKQGSFNYAAQHKNNSDNKDPLFIPLPNTTNNVVNQENKSDSSSDNRLGNAKAQLYNTYIISQTIDSIIIVDQHAAHERLGYEKIKLDIEKRGLLRQKLLIEEIINLESELKTDLVIESKDNLAKLGLIVKKYDNNSVIVSEIPAIIGDVDVKLLIKDIADYISDFGENIKLTELIEHVTETYACHYSIRAGRSLAILEMNELLRQMEQTPFSAQCSHGRPTYIELKLKDIEKLFGRK